jgi:hypothetical protein
MRYLLIVLLALAGSAQARISDRADSSRRWHGYEGMRYRENAEFRRRHRIRHHRRHYRHYVRDENRGARGHDAQDGYTGWRAPVKDESYRGWWRPESGWRDAGQDGARRCRPPMHAAGAADARIEAAKGMAVKAWQEQVINEHGERFLNFEASYVIDEHCDPARVGENNIIELKRCVLTAAPCLSPREGEPPRKEEEAQRQ